MIRSRTGSDGAAPKPGRPRDPTIDRLILQSALKLLTDRGYAGLSVEKVAEEAGVGKTTIYRRYPSKEELAAAAVGALKDEMGPPPNTRDTRKDLIEMIVQNQVAFERGPAFAMIGALLVEERRNPALLAIFRERIIWPRRDEIIQVLQRGVDRGEIIADVDLEIAVQAIVGSILAGRILGVRMSRQRAERIIDTIWVGLGGKLANIATTENGK